MLILVAAAAVGLGIARKNDTKENPLPKVTIGMVTFPGYAPLYLAEEKGFFEGVDVELRRIESISDTRAAMRSGGINMYAATYDIYQSTKEVAPIGVGFLTIDESHGGDGIAVASGINSIAELRGKKVGAEAGFPPYFILQYLLDEEGMTLQDVDFQDLPTTDAGNALLPANSMPQGSMSHRFPQASLRALAQKSLRQAPIRLALFKTCSLRTKHSRPRTPMRLNALRPDGSKRSNTSKPIRTNRTKSWGVRSTSPLKK